MNDSIETTETTETTEAVHMQFPHEVTAPCPNKDALALAGEVLATSQDLGNVMASAGNVHYFVRPHYVDMATGVYGIERMIATILKSHGALFPVGIEGAEFRKLAIAQAMFASEIIAAVREMNGNERYPDGVIYSYLSLFMQKDTCPNKVSKIKLTNAEDKPRPCNKPRQKYYLIDKA